MTTKLERQIAIIVFIQIFLMCIFLFDTLLEDTQQNMIFGNADLRTNKSDTHRSKQGNAPATAVRTISSTDGDIRKQVLNVTEGRCEGLLFPGHLIQKQTWQPVDPEGKATIFSAYNVRGDKNVVIIGAKNNKPMRIICQFLTVSNGTLKLNETAAKTTMLPESHGLLFTATVFECPLTSKAPDYVSLVTESCASPLNLIQVVDVEIPEIYPRRFTVCLSPLHFRYGRAYELVEWIELNKILGAEKFVIYNYSTAINTDKVLDFYTQQGIVEVIQWHLPMGINPWPGTTQKKEIQAVGMLALLQDCMFRNKAYSEFFVNVDLDEFLIPHSENITTWSQMFGKLGDKASVYLFQNTFFRKEWENNDIHFPNEDIAKKYKLASLKHLEREFMLWPPERRSKYIARTDRVKFPQIHTVYKEKARVYVPPNVGLLHHYRNWLKYNDRTPRAFDDRVLVKYGQTLIKNVQTVWRTLKHVEQDMSPFH